MKRKFSNLYQTSFKRNLHISLPEFVQCEICQRQVINYHDKNKYYCSKDCLEIYALTFLLKFDNLSFEFDHL